MRDKQEAFEQAGAAVLVVCLEPTEELGRFRWFRDLPFTVLSDPSGAAYRAFGLVEGRVSQLVTWNSFIGYVRALLAGRVPVRPHGNVRQLGGDFVLDESGHVVFAHRSKEPVDTPTVEALLEAVQRARLD